VSNIRLPGVEEVMRLEFLGKDTVNGGSPTLFATDRDTYVVQGCCAMRRSVVSPV